MIRKIFYAGIATAALMIGAAHATETIVWWDFLSGGDGIRMKAMLDEFNKEHEGKVKIDATTFEWGVPFYSKVQTSAAVGQGPDVMTYHESRMPLGVSTGTLSPLSPDELAASGIKASDCRSSDRIPSAVSGSKRRKFESLAASTHFSWA